MIYFCRRYHGRQYCYHRCGDDQPTGFISQRKLEKCCWRRFWCRPNHTFWSRRFFGKNILESAVIRSIISSKGVERIFWVEINSFFLKLIAMFCMWQVINEIWKKFTYECSLQFNSAYHLTSEIRNNIIEMKTTVKYNNDRWSFESFLMNCCNIYILDNEYIIKFK